MAAAVAAWLALAVSGWLLASLPLVVAAPLPLIALPYLVRLQSGRSVDVLEPIWLISGLFAFTYLIVPLLLPLRPVAFNSLPGYLDAPSVQWEMAVWVSALAFIALIVGYEGSLGPRLARRLPAPGAPVARRVPGPLALAFTLAGVAAVAIGVRLSGEAFTPGDLLSGRLRDSTVREYTGSGYLSVMFDAMALAPPLALLWARREGGFLRWAATLACMAVMALVLFGFLGSRNFALGSIVALVVVFHYRVRRLRVGVLAAVALALLAIAVGQAERRGSAYVADPLDSVGTVAKTLDGFQFLVNTLARTDEVMWGQTVLEDVAITFVPRLFWEGKPLVFGYVRAQEAVVPGLYSDVGLGGTFPIGIVAEGYLNFGLAGALLFPALAALMLRVGYERLRRHDDDYTLLLMAWLIGNAISVIRGLGFVAPLVLIGAFLLLPLLIEQRRAERPASTLSAPSRAGAGAKARRPSRRGREPMSRGSPPPR